MPDILAHPTASTTAKSQVQLSTLRSVADPRQLEIIILPTEQCNFRCTYCYEDFKLGQMSSELVDATKKWIMSRVDDLDQLSISWFGGEPTLALPVVLDISSMARSAFEERGKTFSSHMTTNGYLLNRKTFSSLLNAGVTAFQISLDGPAEIHNQTRLRADGKPTFDVLWGNLLQMASLAEESPQNFEITLRIHYDQFKAKYMAPLIDMITRDLLPSGCFRIDFHKIEQLGGRNDDRLSLATEQEHDIIRELTMKIKDSYANAGVQVSVDLEHYICYAARANSFVLRADGRLGKCTVALNDARNDVGHLNLDGTLEVKNERFFPWIRGLYTGNLDTLACPLHDVMSSQA